MTGTPCAHACPNERAKRSIPPSSRRNDPTATATSAPSASNVSPSPTVSTGCALHSTNAVNPSASNRRAAPSNSTVPRRFRYQYPPSNDASATTSPDTVEYNGTTGTRGATGPSTRANSSSNTST